MKEMELREIFGKNVKRILRDKRMSQRKLADSIPVSEVHLSQWLNGHAMPNMEKLCLIGDILNVSPSDLLRPLVASLEAPLFPSKEIDEAEYLRYKKFRQIEQLFSKAS